MAPRTRLQLLLAALLAVLASLPASSRAASLPQAALIPRRSLQQSSAPFCPAGEAQTQAPSTESPTACPVGTTNYKDGCASDGGCWLA